MEIIGGLGLLGGILTAIGTIVTALNSRRRDAKSDEALFRKELRDEILSLRAANTDCEGNLKEQRDINTELWKQLGSQNMRSMAQNDRIIRLEAQLGIPHIDLNPPVGPE